LVPPHAAPRTGDDSTASCEVVVDAGGGDAVQVEAVVRFLRVRTRRTDGWDDGAPIEVRVVADLEDLCARDRHTAISLPADDAEEDGIAYRADELDGTVTLTATRMAGAYGAARVGVRVENRSGWDDPSATRDEVVRRSFVAAHALL